MMLLITVDYEGSIDPGSQHPLLQVIPALEHSWTSEPEVQVELQFIYALEPNEDLGETLHQKRKLTYLIVVQFLKLKVPILFRNN